MLNHDEGFALGHFHDQIGDIVGFGMAHPRCGFVQHDDISATSDGDTNFQRALLGIAERARRKVATLPAG